jgi:hypothetical protein
MQHAYAMLYCHLWPLWLHRIFRHYLINGLFKVNDTVDKIPCLEFRMPDFPLRSCSARKLAVHTLVIKWPKPIAALVIKQLSAGIVLVSLSQTPFKIRILLIAAINWGRRIHARNFVHFLNW